MADTSVIEEMKLMIKALRDKRAAARVQKMIDEVDASIAKKEADLMAGPYGRQAQQVPRGSSTKPSSIADMVRMAKPGAQADGYRQYQREVQAGTIPGPVLPYDQWIAQQPKLGAQ
jgi:hypothetical protein